MIFLPGDFVCRFGDEGKEMYFLKKGACSIISGDSDMVLRKARSVDFMKSCRNKRDLQDLRASPGPPPGPPGGVPVMFGVVYKAFVV